MIVYLKDFPICGRVDLLEVGDVLFPVRCDALFDFSWNFHVESDRLFTLKLLSRRRSDIG